MELTAEQRARLWQIRNQLQELVVFGEEPHNLELTEQQAIDLGAVLDSVIPEEEEGI